MKTERSRDCQMKVVCVTDVSPVVHWQVIVFSSPFLQPIHTHTHTAYTIDHAACQQLKEPQINPPITVFPQTPAPEPVLRHLDQTEQMKTLRFSDDFSQKDRSAGVSEEISVIAQTVLGLDRIMKTESQDSV